MTIRRGYEEVFIADVMDEKEAKAAGYVRKFGSEYGDVYGDGQKYILCL